MKVQNVAKHKSHILYLLSVVTFVKEWMKNWVMYIGFW